VDVLLNLEPADNESLSPEAVNNSIKELQTDLGKTESFVPLNEDTKYPLWLRNAFTGYVQEAMLSF
jgi:hypothetical protein